MTISRLKYNDIRIAHNERGLISLTDMWRAVGEPDDKNPRSWKKTEGSEFIAHIATELGRPEEDILKTLNGRNGGVWAHWQIALAYAKYLDPAFHSWANQVVRERFEENEDPELSITRGRQRAIEAWQRKGKGPEYIQTRLKGIEVRNQFTDALQAHGVVEWGYGECTNSIYKPLFGGDAKEINRQRGLPDKANVREHMSPVELAGTMFAETLAIDKIKREGRQGNKPCASACLATAISVAATIEGHNKSIARTNKSTEKDRPAEETFLTRRLQRIRKRKD